ncbi:hypothetical protein M378DRAFT_77616 [Amanita muscaria Koide BX008]|uniref:Transcription factor CBF/NF-Y/archaeal histone domain-containing protein n=1 Tax=Amanita muscaria (strain Koide BX008) TaxID=946122 RepID=A0A0C2X7S1_AMAMK|nr:hypothetical protein M378DRAFT_77616 [Amanita muscaria Koide BX008]
MSPTSSSPSANNRSTATTPITSGFQTTVLSSSTTTNERHGPSPATQSAESTSNTKPSNQSERPSIRPVQGHEQAPGWTEHDQERQERTESPQAEPAPITEQEVGEYREQDRFLPIANVSRIMKSAVPPTAKIAKDAKECVQECVSEFISFITSEAAERCQLEKRKTIGGEDILYAMGTLGFENYAETLKIHLAKLRQHQSITTAAQAATLSTRELPQRDMDD